MLESELKKSVVSGSRCLIGSLLLVEMLAVVVGVHFHSSMLCSHNAFIRCCDHACGILLLNQWLQPKVAGATRWPCVDV